MLQSVTAAADTDTPFQSEVDHKLHTWSPCVSSCIGSTATSPLTRTRTCPPALNRASRRLAPDSSAATVVPAGTCMVEKLRMTPRADDADS
jgi:hypothetical protein